MVVVAPNGQVPVKVPDTTFIRRDVAAKLSDITPGTYLATAAVKQPDGTFRASEVRVFSDEDRGRSEGHRPLSSPGSTMTNANVERVEQVAVQDVNGPMLTLKFKGGEIKVFVPPNAPVVRRVPADQQSIVPGTMVDIRATQTADGSVVASQIFFTVEPM